MKEEPAYIYNVPAATAAWNRRLIAARKARELRESLPPWRTGLRPGALFLGIVALALAVCPIALTIIWALSQ
jgi:hypothetical protein